SKHVAAGLRLRSALGELRAEAVLDPTGRAHDASGEACSMRETLRDAVRARERARGSIRHRSGHEALELWRALVAGRWSLVDRFESDGRRYVVAMRNEPCSPDPRGLTAREQTIAEYLALGY